MVTINIDPIITTIDKKVSTLDFVYDNDNVKVLGFKLMNVSLLT